MARDIFITLHRCRYCNRPGFVFWDEDVFSCGEEVCKTLAFTEVRRRNRHRFDHAPEERLVAALLRSLDTLERVLRLDERGEVLDAAEAEAIRQRERHETAYVLSEVRALARRHPLRRSVSRRPLRTRRGGLPSARPAPPTVAPAGRGTASS